MSELHIPESFRGRPYAERHFRVIAEWAAAHSPFYRCRLAGGGVPPLLTREILQAHNDELLDGHPVTGKTSGATSVPVRVHWDHARSVLDNRDNLAYAGWFGGVLPNARIVALSADLSRALRDPLDATRDAQEGIRAWMEKREPDFRGE